METTEKIVEAYFRSIKRCATIPNIRCAGQNEIDLLAVNPASGERFHVECSVSISQGFNKLTVVPFDPLLLKERVTKPKMRRTIGYCAQPKFGLASVVQELESFGFEPEKYRKVIVTWDWAEGAVQAAELESIELWSFPVMLQELAAQFRGQRHYFTDDTIRTLHLMDMALSKPPATPAGPGQAPVR